MRSPPYLVAVSLALGLACQPPPAARPPTSPAAPAPVASAIIPAPSAEEVAVDRLFAEFQGADQPGCVVGIDRSGQRVLTKAYGLANLESGVPNTVDTIFEAGSVSKQFTASAVLLLAREGKLSLDDDVRKYLPELPVYGEPITLRRMLTHTSGLRDWGALEEVAGWPRGTRTYTQATVLELMRRQRALNFPTGTDWSYSNSNYNLAAIVVERVSGVSFPEFTRKNLFAPLGMTHTRWRDDFTRVVPGRATAYSKGKDHAWHLDSPIEDAIGNGGLLTTVADLLLWNENLAHPRVGDAEFVATLEQPGVLVGGRVTRYGLGLFVDKESGLRTVGHDGATAGYRSYLERFPDVGLSTAILCNAGSAPVGDLARSLAKVFLPAPAEPDHGATATAASPERGPVVPLLGVAGLYRSDVSGGPVTITTDDGGVRLDATTADLEGLRVKFSAVTATSFRSKRGSRLEVLPAPAKTGEGAPSRLRLSLTRGSVVELSRVTPWAPDARALAAFEGEYVSDEADAKLAACVRDGRLVLLQGPRVAPLAPAYRDTFTASDPTWLVTFRREAGRISGLDVGAGRMWRLPLRRTGAYACGDGKNLSARAP